MTTHSTRVQRDIHHIAEGAPDRSHHPHDPPQMAHVETSSFPAASEIEMEEHPASETGVTAAVAPHEGPQEQDESQDSRRLREEVHPDLTREAVPESAAALIVEDTVELAEVIQATLEDIGLRAVYETHGTTALEKLQAVNPDVILMDIGLPDISGWKMLDHIKEHYEASGHAPPKIVVITAYGDPANRLVGKLQGIHSYLVKPFTPAQVEYVVRLALRGESPPDNPIGGDVEAT